MRDINDLTLRVDELLVDREKFIDELNKQKRINEALLAYIRSEQAFLWKASAETFVEILCENK